MLVLVVFVILVLALLAGSLGAMLADSSQKTTVEVRGTRALMAAQSGLEYAFYQAHHTRGNGSDICTNIMQGKTELTLNLASEPGLNQCTAKIECQPNTNIISSEGQCGTDSTNFAVSRTLTAQAR